MPSTRDGKKKNPCCSAVAADHIDKLILFSSLFPPQDFFFNSTKGFYCLRQKPCAHPGKGHKDLEGMFEADVLERLREYFRSRNEELFRQIGRRNFDWA